MKGRSIFKHVLKFFAIFLLGIAGGILNRIRGGFLNFPEISVNGTIGDSILRDLTNRLIVFAIPLGFIVSVLAKEKKIYDPYYGRRLMLGILTCIYMWTMLMIGWGTYFAIGRDNQGYKSRIGVFDMIIGHECEGWNFWRRFSLDITGMSLRGLVQTLPIGFAFYCFGYGTTLMISGIAMGVIYEIGWAIPSTFTNFESGTELSEFFFGYYIFIVFALTLLAYRPNPYGLQHCRNSDNILLHIGIWIYDAVLITCTIWYTFFTKEEDDINHNQSSIGLFCSIVFLNINYLFYVVYYRRKHYSKELVMNDMESLSEEREPLRHSNYHNMMLRVDYSSNNEEPEIFREPENPSNLKQRLKGVVLCHGARSPYRFPLLFINFVCYVIMVLVILLFIYNLIYNRAMKPCTINFNS